MCFRDIIVSFIVTTAVSAWLPIAPSTPSLLADRKVWDVVPEHNRRDSFGGVGTTHLAAEAGRAVIVIVLLFGDVLRWSREGEGLRWTIV